VICDSRRSEEAGELEPAVAVRRAHHRNLDALIALSSDASGPFSFDRGPPFELEAELAKEINRSSEVIDDDPYVVHSFERHVSNLQGARHDERRARIRVLASGVPGMTEGPRFPPWIMASRVSRRSPHNCWPSA
jgi:hypothetical protein